MAIGRLDRFAKERKKVPVVSSSHHGSSSKKNAWKKMCKTYMNMTGVKIGNVKDRCWKKKKQLDKMVATKLSTTDSIIQHNDDKTCPGKEWLDGLEDWAMKMGILPSTSTSKSSRPPSSFHTRVKHSWRRRSQWWQKITKYNQRASLGLFSSQNFLSCLCTSSAVALCSNGTLVGTGIAYMAGAAVSVAISNFTQKNQTDYSTTAHTTVTGMEERKRRRDDVMDRAKKYIPIFIDPKVMKRKGFGEFLSKSILMQMTMISIAFCSFKQVHHLMTVVTRCNDNDIKSVL